MSSTASDSRRRSQKAPSARRLTRKSPSFLASVKSFVAAPLSRLFSGSDEFDDSKDDAGKRRRIGGAQNEPTVPTAEDGPGPSKKLRRHSPDRQPQSRMSAYLDPPAAAFAPEYTRSFALNVPPPTSDIPRNEPRTTLSPLRNQLTRTMSIDPPQSTFAQRLSRDVTMRNTSSFALRDQSMEPPSGHSLIRNLTFSSRDTYLPRGSFRMRTSMTPQPIVNREISEPPTIHALGSKPIFVRGPALESIPKPVPTLGDIVQDRRTQSPIRQHSSTSLLFGTQPLSQTTVKARPISAAERALQDLDAYKTPLKPTRVRENKSLIGFGIDATDMFNRKKSYQRMPGARGADAKASANKTKPYAGEAGIKKHLARNKLAEQQEVPSAPPVVEDDLMNDDDTQTSTPEPVQVAKLTEHNKEPFKPIEKRSTMPSQSSLRVGRTFTSRNHIDRPSRIGKSKFSASFEDDEDDDRDEIEEAAKRAPAFNIPAGFSFAKDTAPPIQVNQAAKEPPIPSLPFSIGFSSRPLVPVESAASIVQTPQPSLAPPPQTTTFLGEPSKTGSTPNFFAYSTTPTDASPVPAPAPVAFVAPVADAAPPASSTSLPFSFAVTTPVESSSDHMDDDKAVQPASKSFTFGSSVVDQPSGTSMFESTQPPGSMFSTQKDEAPPAMAAVFGAEGVGGSKQSFSFGKPPTPTPALEPTPVHDIPVETQKAAQSPFIPPPSVQPANTSFSFELSSSQTGTFKFAEAKVEEAPTRSRSNPFTFSATGPSELSVPAAPKATPFSFGMTLPTPKEDTLAKPSFGFGATTTPAGPQPLFFGPPVSKDEVLKTSFSFGVSAAPIAGESKPFSFGTPTIAAPQASTASIFSFGNAPSTPPVSDGADKKGFAFPPTAPGASGSPAPSFSFGSTSTTTLDVPKPFSFSAQVRPTTPPNQDMEIKMDESPTREISVPKIAEPRPTIGGGGFSFGNQSSTGTSLFGTSAAPPTSTTPTFAFGAAPTSNAFSKVDKPEENNSAFGGFGQSNGNSGFSFGSQSKLEDVPRPSTAGAFPFSSPSSATGTGTAFPFGGPGNNSAGSAFGGPSSAPNSPAGFNAVASPSFSYGAPPTTTNPFNFGSQPASPALGQSALPSGGFGSNSTSGFGASAASNPFAASTGPATPTAMGGGGNLFTIGAAPSANRQIKKLPTRRTGAKR